MFSSRICPWLDFGAGEAAGGPVPSEGARRRRGEVGEELEDIECYPKVVLDGVGGDWTELAAVAVGAAAGVDGDGGDLVREGG